MLYTDFTAKLLEMEDVIVDSVVHHAEIVEIHLQQQVKACVCPACGKAEYVVHDYRSQRIRDIPILGKQTVIFLRKRRYKCKHCGKQFAQPVSFLPRYHHMTNRLSAYVIAKLAGVRSFTDIAKEVGLSVSTVVRIFDLVQYPKPKALPHVLAIDEFKGNTYGEKYQCILTDAQNKGVLDILPARHEASVSRYLRSFDRKAVDYFVSDMWQPYARLSTALLPNAKQLVDKYHYVRQAIWAFEAVRKQEQKKFSATHRRYFKRSKQLLIARYEKLSLEQQQQVNVMLFASAALSSAHFLKEKFLAIREEPDPKVKKHLFASWILMAQDSDIPQFVKCANTYLHWSKGIINTFDVPFTNGFTEGCNNKIKVLKRNAYGYRNFKRFRNRILHMFSCQNDKNIQKAAA